jgi:pimeloyl-ACP methyl ester carboxylesterase
MIHKKEHILQVKCFLTSIFLFNSDRSLPVLQLHFKMSKPVLIFIPGAWHSPEGFGTIISQLTPLGYKCIALPLQAVVKQPPVKDLQPDIDALREVVIQESDAGNDVVVVGHSWGGIVVTGALDGLGKVQRDKDGKNGGVVKIAYLCAFAPSENVSLIDAQGGQIPGFYDVKVKPNSPSP